MSTLLPILIASDAQDTHLNDNYAFLVGLSATSPSLGESFGKAYRESKDRAKSYALNDKSEKLFDHLVKVRVLTLFRPKYGLSFDLLLLMVGGLWFGILGWAVSFGII